VKGSVRQHLMTLAEKGDARSIKRLRCPVEFPTEVAYLYGWAMELHAHRRFGMAGPEPVTYADVKAWAELTGRSPDPSDVGAIMRLTSAMVAREEE